MLNDQVTVTQADEYLFAALQNADPTEALLILAKARVEAERRGMERAAGIAKVAWLQGGLNSPLDADEAMALCEGIAQAIRQAAKEPKP
jgi:hypothetical protein